MPHYFFDVHNSVQIRDRAGRELTDVESARQEAVRLAADFASNPHHLTKSGWIIVIVRDDPASVVLRVRIACSVEVVADQTVERVVSNSVEP